MYHISDDPRTKRSARRICKALMECAGHKPFAEVTVSNLNKEHGISRTTFYRLFDNTVDVLEYACEQMGQGVLLHIAGGSPKDLTIQAITALTDHRELIELLYKSGHLNIFLQVQEKYLPLSQLAEGLDSGPCSSYFHKLLARMIPMAIEIWMSEGQKDSPEEIYEKLCHSVRILGQWFSE